MKKLLLIALLFIGLSACDENIEKVDNPAAFTSIEVSEAPKDTVFLYKHSEETYYILNKDTNLVEYRLHGSAYGKTVELVILLLFGFMCLVIGFKAGEV